MIESIETAGPEDPSASIEHAGPAEPSGAVDPSASIENAGPAEPSDVEDPSASIEHAGPAEPSDVVNTVDELEGRLSDLQGAMDQLQSGDLDGAEQAIEALEARVLGTAD